MSSTGGAVPFTVDVPADVLTDLRYRIDKTRSLHPAVLDGGENAWVASRIDQCLAYWRTGFDWGVQQARLNAFPQFRAIVDGIGVHFVHVRGAGPDPLPLLLTNGWPSSFVEYLGLIGPLTDPARYGADPRDCFDVVIPALPGYGFTDHCRDRNLTRLTPAALFDQLMTEVLGYDRYVVHGDDIGGGVANRLGMMKPDGLRAIQTANWVTPDLDPRDPSVSEAERDYAEAESEWDERHGAYAHVQRTRPHTLAVGLNDSPAGLATWIVEKFLTWSDPATRHSLTDDLLLTNATVYWVTQTIESSVRLYALPPVVPSKIVVPSYVVVANEPDLPQPPRSLLERLYDDLRGVDYVEQGGHFLAVEAPDALVGLIRRNLSPHRGINR